MRSWLRPDPLAALEMPLEPGERRGIILELWIVFAITLGLSGARSLLSLVDSLLQPEPLHDQQVAINVPQATADLIDLLKQLLGAVQLFAWGALGLYLLWRAGYKLAAIGLARRVSGRDVRWGIGLFALIGIPGLALYLLSYQLGFSLAVRPSTLDDTWWRPLSLTISAIGNAFAEEVLVVGYFLTRLRQLGMRENTSLLTAAVLRGSYHLYQGIGGFVGNLVMGLIFGRIWQRTTRLWPLIIAHSLLDIVAFVGYAALRTRLSWLP